MLLLPAKAITAADASGTAGPAYWIETKGPKHLSIEASLTWGSGGTTIDAYVQMSFDNGTTWGDVANFNFTTASAKKRINLSSMTPVTTQNVPADATLTSNTAIDGLFGAQVRVKTKSSGTYVATTLAVHAEGCQLRKVA